MPLLRTACLLALSALLCGPVGACKGADSEVENGGSGGTAGAGGSTVLNLGAGGSGSASGNMSGGAGEPEGSDVSECDGFDGLDQCGVTSVEATFSKANVLLVIDKSSSMDDQPKGFELKKWDALKAALEPALSAVESEMTFGLLMYPYGAQDDIPLLCYDENCCEVPTGSAAIQVGIEPGTSSASQVMAALDATGPGGGTPTAAALEAALAYFKTGAGQPLQGDRFVLLATDGGPNCGRADTVCSADRCTPNIDGDCSAGEENCCAGEGRYCLDDAAVVEKIQALADIGVPTFVIGIPGTETYAEYLSTFAIAGGVPNPNSPPDYYAVSAEGGVEGLKRTFSEITTHLVRSCEVDLGPTAPEKKLVNVAVDCSIVPFSDGAGWNIDNDAPTTLVLAGDACEQVEREGARRIDIVYGCPTVK